MADNAEDILAQSEKVVKSGPATEGSIEEFMQGDSYMSGGRHDLEDRGMGSGIGVHQRGATIPEEPEPQPQEPDYVQAAQEPQEPEQNWQQAYGQSENEKGQWRRTAEEAMTELKRIKQEMGGFQAAQQYAPPAPPAYTNPQYGYAPPTAAPPQQQQQAEPQPYFPDRLGKKADDFVEVGDLDSVVQREIAPAVVQLHQQQVYLQQQLLQAQKVNAGITPQVEQQLVAKHPWLNGVPEGPQKIQAMAELQQPQGQTPQVQPPKPPVAPSPSQPAARRVTYVESGKQQQATDRQKTLQQQVQEEFAAAKTAEEQRKVLMKYGMGQVNDFGADMWTR